MVYLWWAVDAEGEVLDVLVQSKRARADYLVERRGLCAGRPARSNRCKSDAMKE